VNVTVIIPALNEEASIGRVVGELREAIEAAGHRCEVIVGDNGSSDATAERARQAGARVAAAPRRGYGSACLAAMALLDPTCEAVLFTDGDGADDPIDAGPLLAPLARDEADLVIGSRALGERLGMAEEGSLTGPQRFGNRLATTLLRWIYGVHFSDLGPFRAIRKDALDAIAMDDPDFGWTVQMQARAARLRLRVRDVAVHYRRRREGTSKVSGNLKGSVMAGSIILRTVATEAARRPEGRVSLRPAPGRSRLSAPASAPDPKRG
jgi:glycosyltransferase involved in cell wall biosynthesis